MEEIKPEPLETSEERQSNGEQSEEEYVFIKKVGWLWILLKTCMMTAELGTFIIF